MSETTNTYGENIRLNEINGERIYTTVIQALEDGCKEPLYPGDERRIYGEALAAVLIQAYNLMNDSGRQTMLRYARGEALDALGERLGVTRLAADPAKAEVQFSIYEPIDQNVVIPAGTRVTTDGTVYFATDRAAMIPAGLTYTVTPVYCLTPGGAYNGIPEGEIRTLVDLVEYIATVQSVSVTSGGDDGEPYTEEGDDRFRERIRLAPAKISTAGTEEAYRYWALSADAEIADAAVISVVERQTAELPVYDGRCFIGGSHVHETSLKVYKNGREAVERSDYTYSYKNNLLTIRLYGELAEQSAVRVSVEHTKEGEVKIIPVMADGSLPTQQILDKVYEACNADDVRPLTDKVSVEAPEAVYYDLSIIYWTEKSKESDVISMVEGEDGAIQRYIKWQAGKLGRNINPDYLRKLMLTPDWAEGLQGVERCEIGSPVFTELSDYQVAQWSGNIAVIHGTED